jgi:hypothetical protein
MIEWKEDAGIDGWTGDLGEQWVLEITPHAKGGWSWCVITDDADQNVPQGWDETLTEAKAHSEQAFFEWGDMEEEHDETAEIVADAVAQERAAVVAFLREQAGQWDRDAAGWAALNHASVMIERGLHRPGLA